MHVFESDHRVTGVEPNLSTRLRWRARRRCRTLNAQRLAPTYRYEVVSENDRYVVVAMQNLARLPQTVSTS